MTPSMTKILVADDDPNLRELLRYTLSRAGLEVFEAKDGVQALKSLAANPVDLVVLDVTMPEMDGLETCRNIRKSSQIPIVFLSSRDEELDRILGLELGGDDYLTKPFSPRELVSRIKAVLRRARPEVAPEASPLLKAAGVTLDPTLHRCWAGSKELTLTVTEFSILEVLLKHPGRAYTREELTDRAYGEGHHLSDRTLDSHIRRIRQKCREADLDPIETVHGLGYRINT
jgi:two-component system OmpR family response regulator